MGTGKPQVAQPPEGVTRAYGAARPPLVLGNGERSGDDDGMVLKVPSGVFRSDHRT